MAHKNKCLLLSLKQVRVLLARYHGQHRPSEVGRRLKGGPIGNYVPPRLQAKVKPLGLVRPCVCVCALCEQPMSE